MRDGAVRGARQQRLEIHWAVHHAADDVVAQIGDLVRDQLVDDAIGKGLLDLLPGVAGDGAASIIRRQADVIAPDPEQELSLLHLEGLPRPRPVGLQLEAVLIEAVRGSLEGQHLLRCR